MIERTINDDAAKSNEKLRNRNLIKASHRHFEVGINDSFSHLNVYLVGCIIKFLELIQ